MQSFNSMTSNKLKAYVYALADPRRDGSLSDRIFYIGKGTGSRCFDHARAEKERGEQPLNEREHKLSTIRDIHTASQEVEVFIVAHGMNDKEAFALEAALIPLVDGTNAVMGHRNQLMWLRKNQIDELYDKPIERCEVELFRKNILVVSLNKQDIDDLLARDAEDRLADATLGSWNLGEERSKLVDCVVGVKHGLVVSIFRTEKTVDGVTKFERIPPKKSGAHNRSRFLGTRVADLEELLVARSVQDRGKPLSKIRPGAGCQFFPALR